MPFVADNKAKRTFGQGRGLELVSSWGRDVVRFVLSGSDFVLNFSGVPQSKLIDGSDPSLPAAQSKILIWNVLDVQLSPGDEKRQLVAEALETSKGVHGYPEGQCVEVRFPEAWDGRSDMSIDRNAVA